MESSNSLRIGEVVQRLQVRFPEITISKIRYLEEEGLISPERSRGGYRYFSKEDVKRLETILKLQKEHFLPLTAIKRKLETTDVESKEISPFIWEKDKGPLYSGESFLKKTKLSSEVINLLEEFKLLLPKETEKGKVYNSQDVKVASLFRELSKFGLEPRHLKLFESFAEREVNIFWQILSPLYQAKTPEKWRKIREKLLELVNRTHQLKDIFFKKHLRDYFGKL